MKSTTVASTAIAWLTRAAMLAAATGLGLLQSGCGGSDSNGRAPLVRNSNVSTLVQGYNPATQEAKPLSNALLFSGASKTVFGTSNTAGFARLAGFTKAERLLLNVGASGYALQNVVVNLAENESLTLVDVALLRMQNATSFSLNTGLSKTLESGAKVSIAGDAVRRADNADITEPNKLRLYLTDIDVNLESLLPADLKTEKDDELLPLQALAAIHVQLDENKASLTGNTIEQKISRSNLLVLKKDKQMDIAIPISSAAGAQATAKLYYFNPLTGFWEAQGTLSKSADGKTYVGKTEKVGYLAAMRPITNTVTLGGCVTDTAGNAIDRARIYLSGSSYAGVDNQVTDAQGKFTSTLKAGEQATLVAQVGQFKSAPVAVDAATQSTINGGACITLDTSVTQAAVSGQASWQNARNFDINIMLPNGDIMFYNKRVYQSAAGEAVRITENADGLSEAVNYARLMKGRHFIVINRFFDQKDGGITSNGGSLQLAGSTFTPPAGEVANRTSQLKDERTHVWLAAVMDVDDECNVSVKRPSVLSDVVTDTGGTQITKNYRDWMSNDDFVNKKLYQDATEYAPQSSDSSYC